MIAYDHQTGGTELAALKRWPDALGDLHARVASRFRRPEVYQRHLRTLQQLSLRLSETA
jgi:hypothetical protein